MHCVDYHKLHPNALNLLSCVVITLWITLHPDFLNHS